MPIRGQIIAVATAIQESDLRNLDHGDTAGPDSRGLFQQRAGWGPEAERMNPATAARMFYTGGRLRAPSFSRSRDVNGLAVTSGSAFWTS